MVEWYLRLTGNMMRISIDAVKELVELIRKLRKTGKLTKEQHLRRQTLIDALIFDLALAYLADKE